MNDITAILHQLEEGRLSTEEAAEKSGPPLRPHLPIRILITAAWSAPDARK